MLADLRKSIGPQVEFRSFDTGYLAYKTKTRPELSQASLLDRLVERQTAIQPYLEAVLGPFPFRVLV